MVEGTGAHMDLQLRPGPRRVRGAKLGLASPQGRREPVTRPQRHGLLVSCTIKSLSCWAEASTRPMSSRLSQPREVPQALQRRQVDAGTSQPHRDAVGGRSSLPILTYLCRKDLFLETSVQTANLSSTVDGMKACQSEAARFSPWDTDCSRQGLAPPARRHLSTLPVQPVHPLRLLRTNPAQDSSLKAPRPSSDSEHVSPP